MVDEHELSSQLDRGTRVQSARASQKILGLLRVFLKLPSPDNRIVPSGGARVMTGTRCSHPEDDTRTTTQSLAFPRSMNESSEATATDDEDLLLIN